MLHKNISQRFQNGAALVEFALVLPFLLLVVLGIIEFGYTFYHLNILNKSVEDAARYFADPLRAKKGGIENPIDTDPATNENVAFTQNLVIYGNTIADTTAPCVTLMPLITECDADSTYDVAITAPIAEHVQVTATYQHEFILGTTLSGIMGMFGATENTTSFNLTASSVMRVE